MRGDAPIVQIVDGAAWIGMPTIALGELHAGFLAGQHRSSNLSQLDRFLAHPVVEEIPVDRDVARLYGEIVTDLRSAGTPIPTNDIWIAACASRVGAELVAYDDHFRAVRRVGVRLLEPT
jgi:tRNA(fMet)-specific endonuclease VapC